MEGDFNKCARCEAFLLDPRCREAIDLSPEEVLEVDTELFSCTFSTESIAFS